MAEHSGYMSAGWLTWGSIKNAIKQCEVLSGATVRIAVSTNVLGRTVVYRASGTDDQVLRFKRLVETIKSMSIYD